MRKEQCMKTICRGLALCLSLCLLAGCLPAQAADGQFDDVPPSSFAYQDILALRQKGVILGMGENLYGPDQNFKRCDFILMLARLLGGETDATPEILWASDLPASHYAAPAVAWAEKQGLLDEAAEAEGAYQFRPEDPITRQEMAVILVRALGIPAAASRSLASSVSANPFTDMSAKEYPGSFYEVLAAYDFGIINGMTAERPTVFNPKGNATREQTAAMMMRFYRLYSGKPAELHGFYAISSYSQIDKISSLTGVTAGWSRLEYGPEGPWLNTTKEGGNDWAVPSGAEQVQQAADQSNIPLLLGVFLSTGQQYENQVQAKLLLSEENRAAAVRAIVDYLAQNPAYQGVTIDFEGFVSADYKAPYTAFLTHLRQALTDSGRQYLLYCAVPPADNYQGYDYRAIGDIVDKLILMAHDYQPATLPQYLQKEVPVTPLAPFNRVYAALRQVTDPETGVRDKSKVLLALSFGAVRWEYTQTEFSDKAKNTTYPAIHDRLQNGSARYAFDQASQSPYICYQDDSDGTSNVVWYENQISVAAKAALARDFGIGGLSLWRLGLVPDYQDQTDLNVWPVLLKGTGK